MKLTPAKRIKALQSIVKKMGGRNSATVEAIAATTSSSHSAVYAWLADPPLRIIPQSKLDLLSQKS